MRIAILSRISSLYSTRRLKETCLKRGHEAKVCDPLNFAINMDEGCAGLLYRGRKFKTYEAVIPRIGSSITFFGTALVRQFEQMGILCLNSSNSIALSRDKLRSLQQLEKYHLPFPQTIAVFKQGTASYVIDKLGGAPVIIKLVEGAQGVGVMLAETKKVAEAIIETLQSTYQNILVQKFVKESRGRDIRVLVVGNKVVAAMRRLAQGDEFRSNVHCGGRVEKIKLDKVFEETALKAASIMGLNVAGVDMLESITGPKVIDINSSPGLEGVEEATGIDVANAIIEFLEGQYQLKQEREYLTINI